MVVLLSDHGVLLGEHGFVGKKGSQAYREVIDVPWMLRHPERRGAGTTNGYFASTHDVAPTALAMAGSPRRGHGSATTSVWSRRAASPRSGRSSRPRYDDNVVAGDGRWLLLSDNLGLEKRLYDTRAGSGGAGGRGLPPPGRGPPAVERRARRRRRHAAAVRPHRGDLGMSVLEDGITRRRLLEAGGASARAWPPWARSAPAHWPRPPRPGT